MASISPSADFRRALHQRVGGNANRCYQCATCSSVCDLSPDDAPFPRRQMLWAQWGLADRLAGDPAVWLCHQCNDCTTRCPRDARPGDVMQATRSLMVEELATPRFMGKLVGNARVTWPLLLAVPILFWVALIAGTVGLTAPLAPFGYHNFVPHSLIYAVYFTTTAIILFALTASGLRFWKLIGEHNPRQGSFIGALIGVGIDICTHKKFGKCGTASGRRWGHFFLVWGFVGAAVTSALLILAIYVLKAPMPLALEHPFKILGNVSAVLLVVGCAMLFFNRLGGRDRAGASTAFDIFFLGVVILVVVTGCLTELGRLYWIESLACWLYIVHLGAVLCLFLTFPYSKFAHIFYRSLAMIHERMAVAPVAAPAAAVADAAPTTPAPDSADDSDDGDDSDEAEAEAAKAS